MKKKSIKSLYNQWSKDYDRHMEETRHYKAIRKSLDKLHGCIKSNVLDINCGTGESVGYIYTFTNSVKLVVANDFSNSMLKIAKSKIKNKRHKIVVNFTNYDASNLKFDDRIFNTVLCFYGIHWFQNKVNVIREINRVLSYHGIFISIEEFYPKITPSSTIKKYESHLLDATTPISLKNFDTLINNNGFRLINRFKEKIICKKPHYMIISVFRKSKLY